MPTEEFPKLVEGSIASCRNCDMEISVRSVRTGRFWSGPFWRLAWVHDDPQSGTDGVRCWAPYATPVPRTIHAASAPLSVPEFGRNL